MQVVICAGGKGSRMGSLTACLPKPMLPLGGKPILEHQIELAARYGCTDIVLLTGYLGEVIERHFGDGSAWGVRLRYHREERPLGTAGAVKEIQAWLDDDFLVFYGDTMMDLDLGGLAAFHQAKRGLATLAVHPNAHPYDSDLLEIDDEGQVSAFYPKPRASGLCLRNLVNAGLYVLSPKILDFVQQGQFADLGRDVFPNLVAARLPLLGYRTAECIVDVGTVERLKKVEGEFLSGKMARLNRKNRRRAVFLDRDGVLNRDVDHVRSPDQLELLPGAAESVRRVNESEYLAVVVSNQPGVAKGFFSLADLDRIQAKLETLLGIEGAYLDRTYYCPHHPEKGFPGERAEYKVACNCRKPAPGLLLAAAADLNIDLHGSFLVGDREVDVRAGEQAGCRTILLRPQGSSGGAGGCPPQHVCADLGAAVQIALSGEPSPARMPSETC